MLVPIVLVQEEFEYNWSLLRQPRQTDVIRQIFLKLFSNWL